MAENKDIIIAKSAGFCPGVKRAIECVLELESQGLKPIYTIGPLIHNKQVTDSLEEKGIKAIENLQEAKNKNGVLIIRAHGITPAFQKEIMDYGMKVIDATCPLVKKVHNVIEEYAKQGYDTIIVGDSAHAEVIGLMGYTQGKGKVIGSIEEAKNLPYFEKVNVVSQTTQKEETFLEIANIIKQKAKVCNISNTICQPTKQRQTETTKCAKDADLVVVVGGHHSANTARLAKLCSDLCKNVIHVETSAEIEPEIIIKSKKIFITAGASTPIWLVEEVANYIKTLRENKK